MATARLPNRPALVAAGGDRDPDLAPSVGITVALGASSSLASALLLDRTGGRAPCGRIGERAAATTKRPGRAGRRSWEGAGCPESPSRPTRSRTTRNDGITALSVRYPAGRITPGLPDPRTLKEDDDVAQRKRQQTRELSPPRAPARVRGPWLRARNRRLWLIRPDEQHTEQQANWAEQARRVVCVCQVHALARRVCFPRPESQW
jgi:hypothetical protein